LEYWYPHGFNLDDMLELVPIQFCGTLSEDLNTCSSCRKRLPEDSKVCKYFLKAHDASTFPTNMFFIGEKQIKREFLDSFILSK
jgi:hypothetical protein